MTASRDRGRTIVPLSATEQGTYQSSAGRRLRHVPRDRELRGARPVACAVCREPHECARAALLLSSAWGRHGRDRELCQSDAGARRAHPNKDGIERGGLPHRVSQEPASGVGAPSKPIAALASSMARARQPGRVPDAHGQGIAHAPARVTGTGTERNENLRSRAVRPARTTRVGASLPTNGRTFANVASARARAIVCCQRPCDSPAPRTRELRHSS